MMTFGLQSVLALAVAVGVLAAFGTRALAGGSMVFGVAGMVGVFSGVISGYWVLVALPISALLLLIGLIAALASRRKGPRSEPPA